MTHFSRILPTFALAFSALCLFTQCGERKDDGDGYRFHNPDIARMQPALLESVASKSRCDDCRRDAHYRLYHIYKQRGSLYTLYEYAVRFPDSQYADSALDIVIPMFDDLYATALQENTIEAWSQFIVKVPEDFQFDAQRRLDSLRWEVQRPQWETEEKAWEQASRLDQITAYQRYLTMYPDGAHAFAAQKRKTQWEEYYVVHRHKALRRIASYEERQRQAHGDYSNLGVVAVVDSLTKIYGNPTQYHYLAVGFSDIYEGERYTHTYTIGRDRPMSEVMKIYLKDYYKLYQNRHFDITIRFRWQRAHHTIDVVQSTKNGRRPKSVIKENGKTIPVFEGHQR